MFFVFVSVDCVDNFIDKPVSHLHWRPNHIFNYWSTNHEYYPRVVELQCIVVFNESQ